jgi:rsbT antagonist protein RsbS
MAGIPAVRIGDTLVATVQEELLDYDTLALQRELADRIERTGAGGVLLDLSVVETVDSFLARLLSEIGATTRLLGAETVVVGIRPTVAITLVELGLELDGVSTSLDVARGLRLLRRLRAERSGSRR